jgi:pimeloyl-ACP methyl ester carboxylesterase
MTSPPLGREALSAALDVILTAHNFERAIVVGHSFGTVVTTYLLRTPSIAPRIAGVVLVDPIPFMLHLPDVAYNFCYRSPRTANEWQLWYFASRDPDISRTLARHFFWSESILFKEDIANLPTVAILSGSDQIVHAEEVRSYLTGGAELADHWKKDDLEVLFFPDLDHSVVFEVKQRRKAVLDALHEISKPREVLDDLD